MEKGELLKATYELFRPPRRRTVSQWADENRILVSDSSSEAGRWRTDRAPYQREIMDAFTDPKIYEIDVMASAQVGKSEIQLNMIGEAVDEDPGPMMYVQPTKEMAEDYSKRRIAPMISACPTLREKFYAAKGKDSNNTISMKLFPGGSLAIIGANSPTDLASKPIRYLLCDEIDRFPDSAGTEGDPIAPIRIVSEFAKKMNGKFEVKGGFMEGKVLPMADIDEIAQLPGKDALYSKVLGTMLAPITSLAVVLGQILEQKGGSLETAEAAAAGEADLEEAKAQLAETEAVKTVETVETAEETAEAPAAEEKE